MMHSGELFPLFTGEITKQGANVLFDNGSLEQDNFHLPVLFIYLFKPKDPGVPQWPY